MIVYLLPKLFKNKYRRMLADIVRKRPSPYLLEYISVSAEGFMIAILFSILFLFISMIVRRPLYEIPIMLGMALIFAGFIYYIVLDRAGWLYLLDRRRKQTIIVRGEIWDFREENVTYSFVSPPNHAHLFYREELSATRAWLFYRREGEIVKRKGHLEYGERDIKSKDDKMLHHNRFLMTSPKMLLLDKFMSIEPPMEVEMVCWKWSKILIEFRPVEGVEYPPEALEYLEQINAMYP